MSPQWSRPFRKGDNPDMIPAEFKLYRKKVSTLAARMDGPFEVETAEGTLRCEDGWLAFDSRGYPYPIAADEFVQIYLHDSIEDHPESVTFERIAEIYGGRVATIVEECTEKAETRAPVDGPFHIIDGEVHPGVADEARCPVCTGVPFPAVVGSGP